MSPTFILEGLAVNYGKAVKFYVLFFTWNNQVYIQQFHRLGPDFGLCQNGPKVPKFIANFQSNDDDDLSTATKGSSYF